MNDEVPDFQSDIPAHLLTNASPQDKYIMENISILSQKSNWLTQTQKIQSQRLEEIKEQTTKTNGKVLILQEQAKRADDVVQIYATCKKYLHSKVFLFGMAIGFVAFFAYVAPWIEINGKAIILAIVKTLVG